MTLEESESLKEGTVLFVDKVFDGGTWLEEAAGSFAENRKGEGTKVIFSHHHHHLPEFLFCKTGEDMAVYHHDEVTQKIKLTVRER
jgi:hypoxanthine phosphoribosyltransferase